MRHTGSATYKAKTGGVTYEAKTGGAMYKAKTGGATYEAKTGGVGPSEMVRSERDNDTTACLFFGRSYIRQGGATRFVIVTASVRDGRGRES